MLLRHLIVGGLIIVTGISACRKEKAKDKLAINNNTDSVIFIDMYDSKEAYNNQADPLVRGYIAAHSKYEILSSPLGETIYLDWYSNGGKITNWIPDNMDESKPYTVVVHPQKKKTYDINNPGTPATLRNVLLNTNKKETKWRAVDALVKQGSNVQSVWTQLTDDERNAEISFRKDFRMTYTSPSKNETHTFSAEDRTTYRIAEIGNGWAIAGNGTEPNGQWMGAASFVKDTLAFVQTNDAQQRSFIFVRQ